jgi:hypothetical protein
MRGDGVRWQRRTMPLPEYAGPDRQPEHEIGECEHEQTASYRSSPPSEANTEAAAKMTGVNNPDAPHMAALLTCRRGGLRSGRAAPGPTGMPTVAAASSASVRAASAWPIRSSNSSLVSRP